MFPFPVLQLCPVVCTHTHTPHYIKAQEYSVCPCSLLQYCWATGKVSVYYTTMFSHFRKMFCTLSVYLSDILYSTTVRCCYFASNSKEGNGNSGCYFDFFPFVCLNLFTRSLAQKKAVSLC